MRTARRASAVVTVSNSNVSDLQSAIGSDIPKVYGAPNGIDPRKNDSAKQTPWKYTGNASVVAVTSGSKPHKGIKALKDVAAMMPEVTFNLIGKSDEVFAQKNIVSTGRLSVQELNEYYQTSSALFFPSRIEGFGLPVLEALVFGTPVVASDIPVMREVGGSASRYFQLDDIESAARELQTVIDDRSAAESMSVHGQAHARQFTWANAACVYRKVFNDLVERQEPSR